MSLALLSTLVGPAYACGGFFCNNVPVDQQGEDILFAVDGSTGEVTVHVQIDYTGAAQDFAWIVPVPQVPEIVLSSDRIFRELALRTQPIFDLQTVQVYECTNAWYGGSYNDALAGASSSSASFDTGSGRGTVEVVATQNVGPYETVTLQAQTTEGLLTWLQNNGYDLPSGLDPVLTPYVSDGAFFVALKLQKDQEVGALQPIALRYPGTGASIPIQLTSIAATPDMRLHVYVLGESRAVPESYLHVQINDLVVDWFTYGSNYEQAITVAADEAGGHAFATDYAGASAPMSGALWSEGRYDGAALAGAQSAYQFFDLLLSQGFVGDSQMLELFRTFLPMPPALVSQGVDEQSFYNCLSCYSEYVDEIPFDAGAFAAAIDERIVTPLRDTQALFDRLPELTRLTSSLSPHEMTVDPTFVFNPDMAQEVDPIRVAQLQYLCGFGGDMYSSPRKLVLADGRAYSLPSLEWFADHGMTEYEYLAELMGNYAIVIEQTSASGQPTVITDHRQDEWKNAEAFNALLDLRGAGCGCDGVGVGGGSILAAALVGLFVRRRRT